MAGTFPDAAIDAPPAAMAYAGAAQGGRRTRFAGRARKVSRRPLAWAVLAIVALAVVGAVLLAGSDGSPTNRPPATGVAAGNPAAGPDAPAAVSSSPTAAPPTATVPRPTVVPRSATVPTSPATTPPLAAAPPTSAAGLHGLRQPFVVEGIRLAAFFDPASPWRYAAVRKLPARHTWAFVALATRNLSRSGFDPYRVAYLVRAADGRTYRPDRIVGSGPLLGELFRLAEGSLTVVRLGFPVPSAATGLVLEIGPLAHRHPVIGVALG